MTETVRILTQAEIDARPTLSNQRAIFVLPDGRFAVPVDAPQIGERPVECCGGLPVDDETGND